MYYLFTKKFLMDAKLTNPRKTYNRNNAFPLPGSEEENKAFRELQHNFVAQYEKVFPDKLAPRTIVILPSLSLIPDSFQSNRCGAL